MITTMLVVGVAQGMVDWATGANPNRELHFNLVNAFADGEFEFIDQTGLNHAKPNTGKELRQELELDS